MKLFLAFILVAGIAANASTSLYRYGWGENVEHKFHFESQLMSGIPGIRKGQYGGVRLSSTVVVQSFPDYSLRIKFVEPQLVSFNSEGVVEEGLEQVVGVQGGEHNELPAEFRRFLVTPFLVHVKGGKVESFYVDREEPVEITNIKRALLSQLNLKVSDYFQSDLYNLESFEEEESLLTGSLWNSAAPSNIVMDDGKQRVYKVYEQSITGECKTIYTINKVSPSKIQELEEVWKFRGVEKEPLELFASSKQYCQGKPYYQISKTRDYNNCKVRPVFQKWTGIDGECDVAKSGCGNLFTRMSTATYYVCGSIKEFTIRKMIMDEELVINPLSFRTDEKMKHKTRIVLSLMQKEHISSPLPLPSNTKKETSLVYHVEAQQQHREGTLNEEVVRKTEALTGYKPILPMPALTEPPMRIIPNELPRQQVVVRAVQEIKRISSLIFRTPESCPSKEDVAGSMMTVAKYLRVVGLKELREIESQLDSQEKKIYYDTVAIVGSNPAVMYIKEKLESRTVHGMKAIHLAQSMFRSVRTPTQELMNELVKLARHPSIRESNYHQLHTVILLQLSNLFHNAYVNPSLMHTKYPVQIYGIFGTKHSTVLNQEYIPYLNELVERANEQEKIRLVAIVALGKLGHMHALKTLVRVAEGQLSYTNIEAVPTTKYTPMERALAVYSMKRVAQRNPAKVKTILMSLALNDVESDQVRIAAISVIPYAQPTITELQKLVIKTWHETSKQVASFIVSTIKNLVKTVDPVLKEAGKKAEGLTHMLKISDFGLQYSHNKNYNTLIHYLNTVFTEKVLVANTKESVLPSKVEMKKEYYGPEGEWKLRGMDFSAYIHGMDKIIDEYLYLIGKTVRGGEASASVNTVVKEQIRHIAEELQLEKSSEPSSKVFLLTRYLGYESANLISTSSILELVEEITQEGVLAGRNGDVDFHGFWGLNLVEVESYGTSEMGLPLVMTASIPVAIAAKGYVKVQTPVSGSIIPEVKAKIFPVVNGKLQVDLGVLLPFTQKFAGASVIQGIHSGLSFEAEAKIEGPELKLIVKVPQESEHKDVQTLHAFVQPYTVVDKYTNMKPTHMSPNKKIIHSGFPKKQIATQILPRSFGVYAEVELNSDNDYVDFASYYHKIVQHKAGLCSLIDPISLVMSSLRQTFVKLNYSPSRSEVKELELKFNIGSIMQDIELSPRMQEIESEIASNEMVSLKEALETVKHGYGRTIHLDALLRGGSMGSRRAFKAGLVYGRRNLSEQSFKYVLAAEFKPLIEVGSSGSLGVLYEGLVEKPIIESRWNKKMILEQDLELKYEGKIKFDMMSSGGPKEVKWNARFYKTPEQKQAVMESPEYKKCTLEEEEGKLLSPVCMKVRHEAASLDKVEITLNASRSITRMPIWTMIEGLIKTFYMPIVREGSFPVESISELQELEQSGSYPGSFEDYEYPSYSEYGHYPSYSGSYEFGSEYPRYYERTLRNAYHSLRSLFYSEEMEQELQESMEMAGNNGQLFIEAKINRIGDYATIKVKKPSGQAFEIKGIRVPNMLAYSGISPLSIRNNVYTWFLQKATNYQTPASCRIEPRIVSTFDNMTYHYPINDCQHVLLMDRKQVMPVAVLTRTIPNGNAKSVKILAGKYDIVVVPKVGGGMRVIINGEEKLPKRGEIIKEVSPIHPMHSDVEIHRYHDDVVSVYVREQMLTVLTNGKHVEVVAPQMLRSRAAGLCGDMNGEQIADLKTPHKCVIRHKLAAISYMLNKEGGRPSPIAPQCTGIAPEDRAEYLSETSKCHKEVIIPTKIASIFNRLRSIVRPKVNAHIVLVKRFDVCFSKEVIKMSPVSHELFAHGPQSFDFVCLPKVFSKTHSILERVKAGENLSEELKQYPLKFRKHLSNVQGEVSAASMIMLNKNEDELMYALEDEQELKQEYLREQLEAPGESYYGRGFSRAGVPITYYPGEDSEFDIVPFSIYPRYYQNRTYRSRQFVNGEERSSYELPYEGEESYETRHKYGKIYRPFYSSEEQPSWNSYNKGYRYGSEMRSYDSEEQPSWSSYNKDYKYGSEMRSYDSEEQPTWSSQNKDYRYGSVLRPYGSEEQPSSWERTYDSEESYKNYNHKYGKVLMPNLGEEQPSYLEESYNKAY